MLLLLHVDIWSAVVDVIAVLRLLSNTHKKKLISFHLSYAKRMKKLFKPKIGKRLRSHVCMCVLVYFASVGVCGCFVNANLCHERTGIYWPFYIFAVGAFSARREIEIGNVACNARVVPKVDRI